MACKKAQNPITIKRPLPKKFIIISEKNFFIKLPKSNEKIEIPNEIQNKINVLQKEILVFFKPYVIPIPRESMLLATASSNELINIMIPPNNT